jgi:hypothetical protein
MDDRGSIWAGVEIFSLRHRVQTGSGAHPASYLMAIRSFPTGVERPGREEADHSSPSSVAVKNAWGCTSIPPYVFMSSVFHR